MTKQLTALIWGCAFIFYASIASADVSLKAFEGVWQGTAVSESDLSTNFPVTVRDLDVEIRPLADGSFKLTWRTVQRQKGDPSKPQEVVKETARLFVPKAGGKVWYMQPSEDLYAKGTASWASLKGQTLTVYSMTLREDGGYDMLVYKRILNGLNMKLDFKALRDGELRRTANGTLIKSAK